jgi:C_GCAxxG_C_C family probable redox protein
MIMRVFMNDEEFNQILTQAYKRMHRYTCAEASLQALLKLWDIQNPEMSWATAGYLGAIMSGETTCGLLIGSSIAAGLKFGLGKESIPEDYPEERGNVIEIVSELYNDFKEKFGSTTCKTLSTVDFSDGDQLGEYIVEKKWKSTCDIFLDYTIRKLYTMSEAGKL